MSTLPLENFIMANNTNKARQPNNNRNRNISELNTDILLITSGEVMFLISIYFNGSTELLLIPSAS
jgi:hypothetical protein